MVVAILAAIPGGCRIADSNQLKDSRQSYILAERGVRLRELRRRQLQVEEDIRLVTAEIAAAEDRLALANDRLLPLSTDLSDRLKHLKILEEDLASTRKKEEAVLASKAALEAAVRRAEEIKKALAAAEATVQERTKTLATRQAAIDDLTRRIEALDALAAQMQKILETARGALPPPPKAPPGKVPPKKK